MKKPLFLFFHLFLATTLFPEAADQGLSLPPGLKKQAYQVGKVHWSGVPEIPLARRSVRPEDVFALTPWELMETLQVLTGQMVKLSDVLPWYDDGGYRLYVRDSGVVSVKISPVGDIPEQILTLTRDPRLPQWLFVDLTEKGYTPGTLLNYQLYKGKDPFGEPQNRRSTSWFDLDRQGRFRVSDRFPKEAYTQDMSLTLSQKLQASGLLAQEVRDFLESGTPQVHPVKHETSPFTAQAIRWWPWEIQNQNSYNEWYYTIRRGDDPMTTRDIIFRDVSNLSPLEIQESFRVLSGKAPELSEIMEEDTLRELKVQLLGFQAYALRFEIIEALKARDPHVNVVLPLEFVMEILTSTKAPDEKAQILQEEVLKTTGTAIAGPWFKSFIIGKIFTPTDPVESLPVQ